MEEYTETPAKKDSQKKKKKEKKEKRNWKKELMEDILLLAVVLASTFFVKQFLIINAVIPSGSMENTIMIKDRVFGSRIAYWNSDPKRGDIVIFRFPDNEEELFIKRVIGLPGDKILIQNGKVYLNDSAEPLEEPYLKETAYGDFGPFYVPEDSYFMMGDNRNWSRDSRAWEHPYVSRDAILAKAVFRYYPFDAIGPIK